MSPARLVPRVRLRAWTLCEAWGEYEGRCLSIEWFGRVFEVALGRAERVL